MNIIRYIALAAFCVLLAAPAVFSQKMLHGMVSEKNTQGNTSPLLGATVQWLGTTTGTLTDSTGHFMFKTPANAAELKIVVSYVGFNSDTVDVTGLQHVNVVLQAQELEGVVVRGERGDPLSPIRTEILSVKDLRKAACCNLSESFENSASVDVSFTDAVTGAKQIKMLGLDGIYTQISMENLPSVRGLNSRSGLHFIPGTWIQSIDISKGAGSVANGYESITGQINVELMKPESSDRFFYNLYLSQFGRIENNLHFAKKLNKKWSTGLLMHGSNQSVREDANGNGFMDIPVFTQLNLLNRWHYQGEGMEAQFGVQALYDDKLGGQINFDRRQERNNTMPYGIRFTNRKIDFFNKTGFFLPGKDESIGLIASASHHNISGYWGLRDYRGKQQFAQLTALYQNTWAEKHTLRTGVSFLSDNYAETLQDSSYSRQELAAGVFAEYSLTIPNKFSGVLGLRADQHNLFGTIFTPRLHLKYDFTSLTTLRLSAGRGFRVANLVMENTGFMVSSRRIEVQGNLKPEIAWNYGGSLRHKAFVRNRDLVFTLDLYRTDFVNQVIVDLDADPGLLRFYNLNGRSFANSVQLQADYEVIDGLDISMAYKYYNVQATINNELRSVPFVPQHRTFGALSYDITRWRFDFNINWFGTRRLPTAPRESDNSLMRREEAPSYFLMNAQITRVFKKWDWYLGMENLNNFTQADPIVSPESPYSSRFDGGMVWAPIMGRMLYMGIRIPVI